MRRTHKELNLGIESFGQEVSIESARSLHLLKDIDITVSAVNRLTAQLHADASFAEKLMTAIERITCEIDPEDIITSKLEKAQSAVYNLYNELIARRESGRTDTRLSEDDGIEASYTDAIAAAADLQNNLNELRWHVLEHDADFSPVSKTYTDVKELIKDLVA